MQCEIIFGCYIGKVRSFSKIQIPDLKYWVDLTLVYINQFVYIHSSNTYKWRVL